MTTRLAHKSIKLSSILASLHGGQTLPSSVKGLRLRYQGLQGSASAKRWTKEYLPALKFANPDLEVSIELAPSTSSAKASTSKSTSPSTTDASSSSTAAASTSGVTSTIAAQDSPALPTQRPGVWIIHRDETKAPTFFPMTKALPKNLNERLLRVIADPKALEDLSKTGTLGEEQSPIEQS